MDNGGQLWAVEYDGSVQVHDGAEPSSKVSILRGEFLCSGSISSRESYLHGINPALMDVAAQVEIYPEPFQETTMDLMAISLRPMRDVIFASGQAGKEGYYPNVPLDNKMVGKLVFGRPQFGDMPLVRSIVVRM